MVSREQEMAVAIDALDDDIDDEVSEFVAVRPPANPSQVYSVRIPVDRLEQLRLVAESQGIAPSALMRHWVLERLDNSSRREYHLVLKGSVSSVAEAERAFKAMELLVAAE